MTDIPCQKNPELFEPFVALGETMPLRGLRLVNAQKFCENCPIRQTCENMGNTTKMPRGVWGGRVFTRLDQPKVRRRKKND